MIESTRRGAFENFVDEVVPNKVGLLATDEHIGYRHLSHEYSYGAARHQAHSYVVCAVVCALHTSAIEGFWSLIKRGVVGIYRKVIRKYLPLYVAKFQFRYDNCNNENVFAEAIKGC